MLIWDLCGGTGAWSAPYREAGYCVETYDLTNGRDVRLLGRTRAGVWGILAAPPLHTSGRQRGALVGGQKR